MTETDIVIIGGGIAGISLAARLAGRARVLLLEREDMLAMHTTGRSAAIFSEVYGNATVCELTRSGRAFFENPPEGFSAVPLLTPRPTIFVAAPELTGALGEMIARDAGIVRPVAAAEVQARVPVLRTERLAGFAEEFGSMDIDVGALFEGFRRLARHGGVEIATGREVTGLARTAAGWDIRAGELTIAAKLVVNAAGAWAGRIGQLAGLGDRGLVPMRRTAMVFEPPEGLDVSPWPFVNDLGEQFYFKPEAGLLLASLADETPSEPCDAQPDEYDIALTAHRIEEATTLSVRRIRRRWAGLRTFTPDRTPLFAFDDAADGFFWLAGQGGYGIQTCPAISQRAADALLERL